MLYLYSLYKEVHPFLINHILGDFEKERIFSSLFVPYTSRLENIFDLVKKFEQ